jgi:basic membrane protein A
MTRRAIFTVLAAALVVVVSLAGGTAGAKPSPLRVVIVNPPGLPFAGGTSDPIAGLRRAIKAFGVTARAVIVGTKEDWSVRFSSLAAQRYDLVIAGTGDFFDTVNAVAPRFPRTRFLTLDVPQEQFRQKRANVAGTDFRQQEAGYLAGYLGGLVEQRRPGRDVVSSVGGIKYYAVDAFIAGYQAGARKAVPGITTLNGYANSFGDVAKCKAVALSQIARGSGVVFQVAGRCGEGALAAAKERGVWGIGVDDDQSDLGPHILTSAVKRFDVAVFRGIEALVRGRFPGGRNVVLDVRNGGVGLGKISPRVPRSFVRQVENVRRRIVSGAIKNIPTRLK